MIRRNRFVGAIAVAVAGLFWPSTVLFWPSPGAGAQQVRTECVVTVPVTATPGFSETPSSGSFFTPGGETGTVDCKGPVQGETPTGAGTFSTDGRYGTGSPVTCSAGGDGWGVHSMTVPTSQGKKNLKSAFTFKFGGLENGVISGAFEGDYYSGTFETRPRKGDCVTAPLTEAIVTIKGTLHEYRGK